ncbi:flagellar motor switch protein FliN/FliY [Duganella sp. 3397]|uniref:Flagellar motor switch protein FliN n=1 Tax=Duganella phyllosphaerae TaxID=762836 RepID=A0A1E7X5G7_9BURK|nr:MULTISPECIES: FliM/FliN family flagellar motor switch protein [Duganella]MDR7051452.1 flagellar motor switch protein FliN/FliY [Duganella sp. 3397]OFA08001.1 flagellar motor switch protein FliN [Duganella phyllosphaerae]
MNMNVANPNDAMLEDLSDEMIIEQVGGELTESTHAVAAPRRDLPAMMRKIPVTLTLEVGSARISLEELMAIGPDSVVELDVLAGEPLVIKVNGTAIGRAEVVVAGENYGLKVLDLDGLNLDLMTP